jgi:hypothetical protein
VREPGTVSPSLSWAMAAPVRARFATTPSIIVG